METNVSPLQGLVDKQNEAREASSEATPVDTPEVVEPQVESPAEVTPVEAAPVEAPEEVVEPTIPEPVVNEYEGYVSPQELESLKQDWLKENSTPSNIFANEQMEFLNKYVAEGGELNEKFFKYQNADFDALDLNDVNVAMDVIEQSYADVNGFTSEQIEVLMRKDYPDLYRDIDEDDEEGLANQRTQSILTQIKAKEALGKLKEYKDKVTLPPNKEVPSNEPTPEQIAAQEKIIQEYQANASKALGDFTGLSLDLGDEVSISYSANDENMGHVRDLVMSGEKQSTFFRDNYLKDGKIDYKSLMEDEFWRRNKDAIIKEIRLQSIAIGKDEVLKDTGVQPQLGKQKQSNVRAGLSVAEQMSANLRRSY